VALHVVSAAGEMMVAQADYGLPEPPFACQATTITLTDVPPGEYKLLAIVYAWESGARLTGTLTATGEQGDALPLATFTVAD